MTTSTKLTHLVACLIALTCIMTVAQTASAQRCNKRPEDLKFVREMKDVGADLAVVVAEQSTIYEQPSAASKALLRVKRANFLALVKRDAVRTWYRVIEVDSATEGWIDECDVILKLTDNRESGPPLEEEPVGTIEDPELSWNRQPT